MKVRLSGEARAYLLAESAYLRKRSPIAAQAFLDRMREARQNLARFPEMGRGIERLPVPGSLRVVIGEYLLDYDIDDGLVLIVNIRHGAQQRLSPDVDDDFDYETCAPDPDAKP